MRKLSIQYKLNFKSYHSKYFNLGVCVFLSKLKSALGKKGLHFFNLIRVPKRRNHFTVIKSPFAQKSSREQFKFENIKLGLRLPFVVDFSRAVVFEKILEEVFGYVNHQNFVSVTFSKSYS